MTQKDLAKTFRNARKKFDKTQEKVAWEIGISREHYAKMEGNKVNITKGNVAKLEKLFDMEINSEFFEDDDKKIELLSSAAFEKLKKCSSNEAVTLLKAFNATLDLIVDKN